jgi:hypothetical protein
MLRRGETRETRVVYLAEKRKGEREEKEKATLCVADSAARDKQRFSSHRDF